jgi:hypothetical protein
MSPEKLVCVLFLFLLFVSSGKMRIHLRSHLSTTIFVLLLVPLSFRLDEGTKKNPTRKELFALLFFFYYLFYFSRPNNGL